jgi:hypothetical protein
VDVTTAEWLLFGHLLAVVAWVGADAVLQILAMRARRAGGERMVELLADVEWLGTRYLIPSALAVVAFGFALLGQYDDIYELSQFWVAFGLAVFIASFIAGAGFLGPESGRLKTMAASRDVDDPELQRRIRRIFLISRIELVLLIAAIFVMVAKPGL